MVNFPGGPVVKNPSASAGNTGLIPNAGRSHMPSEQLNSGAIATVVLRSRAWAGPQRGAPTLHN